MTRDAPTPPGPAEKFDTADDLLTWLRSHFEQFGDIFRASIYGSVVYVISAPEYAEHVLLRNWQNYPRKGHAVKRIALTLGNGLMSSNGEFWVNQRRMIQWHSRAVPSLQCAASCMQSASGCGKSGGKRRRVMPASTSRGM